MDCPRRQTETQGQHPAYLHLFPLYRFTSCPFHSLIKPLVPSPPPFLCSFPPLHFASFHPSLCVCVLYVCEGRCLPAGCQVTSLIEGPLESRCYQRLNPLFRSPLSFFLLFTPSLFSSLALKPPQLPSLSLPPSIKFSLNFHSLHLTDVSYLFHSHYRVSSPFSFLSFYPSLPSFCSACVVNTPSVPVSSLPFI